MVCTLSKAQVRRLIKKHSAQLSVKLNPLADVYIVLPDNVNDAVDIQDILGNITVKEAWVL